MTAIARPALQPTALTPWDDMSEAQKRDLLDQKRRGTARPAELLERRMQVCRKLQSSNLRAVDLPVLDRQLIAGFVCPRTTRAEGYASGAGAAGGSGGAWHHRWWRWAVDAEPVDAEPTDADWATLVLLVAMLIVLVLVFVRVLRTASGLESKAKAVLAAAAPSAAAAPFAAPAPAPLRTTRSWMSSMP